MRDIKISLPFYVFKTTKVVTLKKLQPILYMQAMIVDNMVLQSKISQLSSLL